MSEIHLDKDQFLPIQSLDIEAETSITFNLYVNLPLNQKYILYRRAGGSVEYSRLEKLTESRVNNFFIEKKDYAQFVKYVSGRLCGLLGMTDSLQKQKAMESVAKSILTSTLGQNDPNVATALMNNLNDIAAMVIENTLENTDHTSKKIFRRLVDLSAKGTDFQKHPVNVASLAVLLTFGIGYSRPEMLSDVAIGSLLHDVGLSKLSPEVASSAHDPVKLKIKDRADIYKHPELAIKVLEEKRITISPVAKTIILQHHEEFNGSGYPAGLRGFMINELAQILRVADEIDQMFHEPGFQNGGSKAQVAELLRRFREQKIIEPLLLSRIRKVLT